MTELRHQGMKLADCKPLAEEAAPSVLYFALEDRTSGLAADPAGERGERYYEALVEATNDEFREDMLGIPVGSWRRYLWRPRGQQPKFLSSLDEISLDDRRANVSYLSLSALALNLVAVVPKPLFTLIVPASFEQGQATGSEAA